MILLKNYLESILIESGKMLKAKYDAALPKSSETASEIGSDPAKTSIKQIASGIKKFPELIEKINNKEGLALDVERNLDYGGGKFNLGKKELRKWGIDSQIYDLYSRTPQHNERIAKLYKEKNADSVTLLNVLNVIEDNKVVKAVVKDAFSYLKKGGVMIIQVYEGDESGEGKKTSSNTFQRNAKLDDYKKLIQSAIGKTPEKIMSKYLYIIKN